tara:strand:+ start:1912 stop:2046 length:135 start_codon:yes stop_codon:yes gene_type:complete
MKPMNALLKLKKNAKKGVTFILIIGVNNRSTSKNTSPIGGVLVV